MTILELLSWNPRAFALSLRTGALGDEERTGKSARISRTSALVSLGALGPAVRTGNPVTGSRMIRAFRERTFRGVRTICCPSTLASSESPGCSPSLRRILLGTTTCPLVETVVIMVRLPYQKCGFRREAGGPGWTGTTDLALIRGAL